MSVYREKRIKFSEGLRQLMNFMHDRHYIYALGEGADFVTTKDLTTDHMRNSLHELGLAQDIHLYDEDGNYLTKTEDYTELGAYWESLDYEFAWGGRFGDGNHFSLKYGGRK